MPSHALPHTAHNHSPGQFCVLASLPKVLDMNFNQFRQPRHAVVPLVGEPVSPTALYPVRLEYFPHRLIDSSFIRRRVEIKIRSEIWPVIE